MTAADLDHAVVGDADLEAGQRPADRADAGAGAGVDRRGRGGLGQPVALQDGHADAAEEVPEPGAERRAAGDRPAQLPAERRPDLAVDEPVEHAPGGRAAAGPAPPFSSAWL